MVSRRLWFPEEELKADRVAQAQKMLGDAFKGVKDAAGTAQQTVQQQFEEDRLGWAQKQMEQAFSTLRQPPTPPQPEPLPEPAAPPPTPAPSVEPQPSTFAAAPEAPAAPPMVNTAPVPGVDIPDDGPLPGGMNSLVESRGAPPPERATAFEANPPPGGASPYTREDLGGPLSGIGDAFSGLGTRVHDLGFRAPGSEKGILGATGPGTAVRDVAAGDRSFESLGDWEGMERGARQAQGLGAPAGATPAQEALYPTPTRSSNPLIGGLQTVTGLAAQAPLVGGLSVADIATGVPRGIGEAAKNLDITRGGVAALTDPTKNLKERATGAAGAAVGGLSSTIGLGGTLAGGPVGAQTEERLRFAGQPVAAAGRELGEAAAEFVTPGGGAQELAALRHAGRLKGAVTAGGAYLGGVAGAGLALQAARDKARAEGRDPSTGELLVSGLAGGLQGADIGTMPGDITDWGGSAVRGARGLPERLGRVRDVLRQDGAAAGLNRIAAGGLDGVDGVSPSVDGRNGRPRPSTALKLDAAGELIGGVAGAAGAQERFTEEEDPAWKKGLIGAAGFTIGSQAGGQLRRNARTLGRAAEAFSTGKAPEGGLRPRVIPPNVARGLTLNPQPNDIEWGRKSGFMPNRMDIAHSIRNTKGARLFPDGTLELDLWRMGKAHRELGETGRGGVFYYPTEAQIGMYNTSTTAAEGGQVLYKGPSAFRNVLFVDETGSMGRDIGSAFLGKAGYEAAERQLDRLITTGTEASLAQAAKKFEELGWQPDEARQIATTLRSQQQRSATGGPHGISYALPESIGSGILRSRGYEAAIGVSRAEHGRAGALGEVFDVRESAYPGKGPQDFRVQPEFTGDAPRPLAPGTPRDPSLKQIARAEAEGRIPKGMDSKGALRDNAILRHLGLDEATYEKGLPQQAKAALDHYLFDEDADRSLPLRDFMASLLDIRGPNTKRWSDQAAYEGQQSSLGMTSQQYKTATKAPKGTEQYLADISTDPSDKGITYNPSIGKYESINPATGEILQSSSYYSAELKLLKNNPGLKPEDVAKAPDLAEKAAALGQGIPSPSVDPEKPGIPIPQGMDLITDKQKFMADYPEGQIFLANNGITWYVKDNLDPTTGYDIAYTAQDALKKSAVLTGGEPLTGQGAPLAGDEGALPSPDMLTPAPDDLPGTWYPVDPATGGMAAIDDNWENYPIGAVFHGSDEVSPYYYVKVADAKEGVESLLQTNSLLEATELSIEAQKADGYPIMPGTEPLVTGFIETGEGTPEDIESMSPGDLTFDQESGSYIVKLATDEVIPYDTYLEAVTALHHSATPPYALDPNYIAAQAAAPIEPPELAASNAGVKFDLDDEEMDAPDDYELPPVISTQELADPDTWASIPEGMVWEGADEGGYMVKTGQELFDYEEFHSLQEAKDYSKTMAGEDWADDIAATPGSEEMHYADGLPAMEAAWPQYKMGDIVFNLDTDGYHIKTTENYQEAPFYENKSEALEAAALAAAQKALPGPSGPDWSKPVEMAEDDLTPEFYTSAPVGGTVLNADSGAYVVKTGPNTTSDPEGDWEFFQSQLGAEKAAQTAKQQNPTFWQKLKAGAKTLLQGDPENALLGVRKQAGGEQAPGGPWGVPPARTPEEIHAERQTRRAAKPSEAALRQREQVAEAQALNEQGGTGQGATNPVVRATGPTSPGNLPKIRQRRGTPAGGPHTPAWDEATMGTKPTSEFDDENAVIPPIEALAAREVPITMADAQAIMSRQAADVRREELVVSEMDALPAEVKAQIKSLGYLKKRLAGMKAALPAQQQAVRELAQANARAQGETAVGLETNVQREASRTGRRAVNRAAREEADRAAVFGTDDATDVDTAEVPGGEDRVVDQEGRVVASRGPEEVDLDGKPVAPARTGKPTTQDLTPEGGVAPGGVVGQGSTIGAGTTIGEGVTIGAGADIGAGTVARPGTITRPGATAAPGMLRAPVQKPAAPGTATAPATPRTRTPKTPAAGQPATGTPRARGGKAATTTAATAPATPGTTGSGAGRGKGTPPPRPVKPVPPNVADTGWLDANGKLKSLEELEGTIRKELEDDYRRWESFKKKHDAATTPAAKTKVQAEYEAAVGKLKAKKAAEISGLSEADVLSLASKEVGVKALMARSRASSMVGENQEYAAQDFATNYARANLIGANPITMARNAMGGVGALAWQPIETLVASAFDPLVAGRYARRGLDTKQDRRYGKEIKYLVNGYTRALPAALTNMMAALREGQGYSARGLEERLGNQVKGGNRATTGMRSLTDAALKPLTATDAFFRTMTQGGEVMRQSYRQMKASGMSDADIEASQVKLLQGSRKDYVKKFGEQDTAKLAKGVQEQTDYRAFGQGLKEEDRFGRFLQDVQRLPGGSLILPFVTTPYNAAKFDLERSPAGFMKALKELALPPKEQVKITGSVGRRMGAKVENATLTSGELSDRLSRGLVGSALFAGLLGAAVTGKIDLNGNLPETQDERDEWEAQGRRPYSVKMGDRYVSFQDVPGVQAPLMQAAVAKDIMNRYGDQDRSLTEAIGIGILESIRSLAAQPMAGGLLEFAQSVGRPGTSVTNQALGLVGPVSPMSGIMRTVNTAMDPMQREQPVTASEAVSRVYAPKNLPARRTAWGDEMENQNFGLPGLVNPLRTNAAARFEAPTRYMSSDNAATDVAVGRSKAKVDAYKRDPVNMPMPDMQDWINAEIAGALKNPYTELVRGQERTRSEGDVAQRKSRTLENWLAEPVRR